MRAPQPQWHRGLCSPARGSCHAKQVAESPRDRPLRRLLDVKAKARGRDPVALFVTDSDGDVLLLVVVSQILRKLGGGAHRLLPSHRRTIQVDALPVRFDIAMKEEIEIVAGHGITRRVFGVQANAHPAKRFQSYL